MRRWSQRRPVGFNLAFLDIMACGLGAIILVFMLVKYHAAEPDTELAVLRGELAALRDEVESIQSENSALSVRTEALKEKLQREITRAVQSQEEASASVGEFISLTREIAALEQKLARQKQRPAQSEPADAASAGEKTRQEHLIGLRVSGARILILLDNSASMADERLVDIVKIKASDAATKKAAPKWRRAVAAVNWILDRVPEGSEYMLVHYNAGANFLPDNKWLDGGDASARSAVSGALAELHPSGATNLHAALTLLKTISLHPTDVYVITDSLPTQGPLPVLRRLKACGVRNKNNVSGACRSALFFSAVRSFRSSAKINTVLLPIEGDPEAAYAYWLWAATTTGMMISPTGSWP